MSMTALSGTTRPEPSSTRNSTSPNMSGLSAPPWLATSMRTLTVRVAPSRVGAMFDTWPRHARPAWYDSVSVAGIPSLMLPRSDS